MAYFRGPLYVWADHSHVHFWNADGFDSWDESVWAQEYHDQTPMSQRTSAVASGVQIRKKKWMRMW